MNMIDFLTAVQQGKIWGPQATDFTAALVRWQEAKRAGYITFGPKAEHRSSQSAEGEIDLIGPAQLTDAGRAMLSR